MRNNKVQKMVGIAMLAAIAVVLQFAAFPILPLFEFLKIDFSDLPIMIGMFLFGPFAGIATALIRSFLHFFLSGASPQNLVGDFSSFCASIVFTLPVYAFFKRKTSSWYSKFAGLFAGVLVMTIVMSIANYYIVMPIYLNLFGVTAENFLHMTIAKYVVIGIIPFNLVKGFVVSCVFLIVYAKLLPWLSKKTM